MVPGETKGLLPAKIGGLFLGINGGAPVPRQLKLITGIKWSKKRNITHH